MKISNLLLLSILMTLVTFDLKAQKQSGANLFEFMRHYYEDNPFNATGDTSKRNGFAKEYDRTFQIWGPRLYPYGNFKFATQALSDYHQNFQANNNSNSYFDTIPWSALGPQEVLSLQGRDGIGQIHRITLDPQFNNNSNQTIYAASFYGGLWKTINKGASWEVLNTDSQLPMTSVSDVAVDYNNSDNLFICTGQGDAGIDFISNANWGIINPINTSGIYRSTNGGLNWEPINTGFMEYFATTSVARRMIINPQNSNQLFVATSSGIFRTNNALAGNPIWSRLTQGLDTLDTEYRGLEFMPGNPSTIYTSGKDIYKSVDGGNTWQCLTIPHGIDLDTLGNCSVNRINLTVTPADPSRLYAYIEGDYLCPKDTSCHKAQIAYIYLFDNNKWKRLLRQHCHDTDSTNHRSNPFEQLSPCWLGFAASPTDSNTLFFGYTKVKSSRNISDTVPLWHSESDYWDYGYHADCHALVIPPKINNNPYYVPLLMAATHGGVSMKQINIYAPSEVGWKYFNTGLNVSMIWSFDVSKMYKDYYLAGFQCNGTKQFSRINNSNTWKWVTEGDGYGVQIGYQAERISFIDMNDEFWRYKYEPGYILPIAEYSATSNPKINLLPFDPDPAWHTTVYLPKTFQIHKHVSDTMPTFGFTELFERKRQIPILATDTINPDSLWRLQSDISKVQDPTLSLSQRQITEFAIAPGNKNYIYIVVGGQIDPTWGVVPPQLYRSVTGGNNGNYSIDKFSNLTDLLPVIPGDTTIYHPIITGIAVHPDDPNKIWICFTGYYDSLKVYYSTNGGNSWSNYDPTGSLPNLPVNGIVYQEGSNDRLYIATDAGVYVKDAPDSLWVRYGNLPNVRVTEIKINPCTGKLCAATFGRGLWETDLLPANNVYQEINTTETWANDRIIENSFIVKSPNILTVTGTLYMPKGSRIIVEPGAELILDGGRITQNCGYLWKGIEVWGNRNISQIPVSNQGKLQIIHEGKIENAEIAILAGKRLNDNSGFDPTFAGGLIYCTDGNFVNNQVAVQFTPYTYFNNSHFRNTDFLTSGSLNENVYPDAFIKAYGVADVAINGCSFRNTRDWNDVSFTDRGTGIFCDNSRIFVQEGCLVNEVPCTQPLPSSFEKLSRGIYSMNNGSITYMDIRNTNFFDNLKGLYISASSGVAHSTVISCNFRVFRPGEDVVDAYGMYLNECSGYQVEENTFYSVGSYYDGIGLIVNNSIVDNNEINRIYRNTFSNLLYASIAQNINRNSVTGEGLCYKCNKFYDNYSDIAVTKDPNIPTTREFGIAVNQGTNIATPTGPAGNMFDYSPLPAHWDLDNDLASFNYYYHFATQSPFVRVSPDYRQGAITPTAVPVIFYDTTACPPSTSGGGGSSEDNEGMELSESMSDSISSVLSMLVDGGSTETLNQVVETSTPPEAIPTQEELLAVSPFLSDTVVQTAIKKEEVLTNSMIRDILVANPQSAKSDTLVVLLENRSLPMPADMISEILQGVDSISAKESLESQKAFWNAERSEHYHNLIRYYRHDTLNGSRYDSLQYLLQQRNTPNAWYELSALYFHQNEHSLGMNLLNLIPVSFPLSLKQVEEHQAYMSFFDILNQISADSNRVLSLDSSDVQMLTNLQSSGNIQLNAFSRNILLTTGKTSYQEPIFLPVKGLKSSKSEKYRRLKSQRGENLLKVYPNPAKTHFFVEYQLNEIGDDCSISVTDMMGKRQIEIHLLKEKDQFVIPVNHLIPGVYLVSLKCNGISVCQAKVTIIN